MVSQETGFVDAIVKQVLHTVMLLFFFFFDYWRAVSQKLIILTVKFT